MRILVVKLSSIGDVVHTLPAVASLRRAHPCARISWIVDVRASAILKGSPAIDEVIEIDSRRWRKTPFDPRTLEEARQCLGQLRGGRVRRASYNTQDASSNGWPDRPDIAIDFQGLVKSGLIALLSGANRRVGFASPDLREKASRYLLTDQMSSSRAVHVIEKNLELAECIPPSADEPLRGNASGADGGRKYEFPIAVSLEDQTFVNDFVSQTPRSAIINPGGGWITKLWPPARYSELVDWLWSEFGIESFITYGPGEARLARDIVSASRSGKCREIALTLKQFVALARRATLFVGGDTGPLHLAAAAGAPIVGLYGPTSPARNGPFDERDITVGRDLWCRAGCHRRKCWHWQCMQIPTSEVKRAIIARLSTAKPETEATSSMRDFIV